MLKYSENKHDFTIEELVELWSSVGWTSGSLDHPDRLQKALKNSYVVCVYEDTKLVGLLEAFDDTYTSYLNYLLIHPDYQKQKIGSELMTYYLKRYEGYRLVCTTDEAKAFYERFGMKHTSYGMHK